MAYKITGRVLAIGNAETFSSRSGNSYTKRDLVITVRKFDPYTGQPSDDEGNTPKFTYFSDKCRDLDAFKVGDIVTVNFEIYGREYIKDGKTDYITDVRPTFVSMSKQPANTPNQASQPYFAGQQYETTGYLPPAPTPEAHMSVQSESEELPF